MTQKYRMLKSAKGVHDGQMHPTDFHQDAVHEIGDSLAGQFIEMGIVEMVTDETTDEAEEKSRGDAPSNKAKAAAPSNKAK